MTPRRKQRSPERLAATLLCALSLALAAAPVACSRFSTPSARYDVIIRHGEILDGSGQLGYAGDVAIRGERIAAMGNLGPATAARVIDATGLAVAPGFIDMLGQSEWALLIDPRSLSKLSQGITTEITGEGGSVAPQDALTLSQRPGPRPDWTDLDGYFRRLARKGTPLNLGTYVGAAQVREAVIGFNDRAPTAAELAWMEALVAQQMQEGAMGLSTALIYPPGQYAQTSEIVALARVAARYGGIYATHMRSEGYSEMAALNEALQVGREANIPVEIFHLKISGKSRWGDMPKLVAAIDAARASGVRVAANMYPYLAGATALASCLPPWVANGGRGQLLLRLHDPAVRRRIAQEMSAGDHPDWENLYFDSGGAGGVVISSVANPALKRFEGQTVAQMAVAEGKPPLPALFDFIVADQARTGAFYFIASEPDLQFGLKQPWVSIGLDAGEASLDGPLFRPHGHPRAWGSMPRFLGHYARDLQLVSLPEAVRKITSLPADEEHLRDRGQLRPGDFADITIFDPRVIVDRATYAQPNQVSLGVHYVFVNGTLEYANGALTGALAGQALRGPGWRQSGNASR